MLESAYDTLRVRRDTNPEEARKAYLTLVRRYPPEHFPDKFASIRRAYQYVTLDEEFVEEMFHKIRSDSTPLEMAGYLWGDRKELKPTEEFNALSFASLLVEETMCLELDELLSEAAESIEYRIE
ncbi:MAG: hypothetical protein LBD04_05540 [Synergistaceae bacterium]|jgi:curved DNA-binding protein CbpA|nr:hypothetical protein [Synergistaceae bacterium]